MHKKAIAGSEYYYTTYRDNAGRHRTAYLGKDPEAARRREQKLFGKASGLRSRSYKNLCLLLTALCGLGLIFLSGQATGFFSYEPSSTMGFDVNASWNLSEALVRVSIGNFSIDLSANDLVTGGKIVVDAQTLQLNMTGRLYADLIVGNELVESRYLDIVGGGGEDNRSAESEPDTELLRAELSQRLNVNVSAVDRGENYYMVTVDIEGGKKGSVTLQVNNVSDIRKVQVVSLPERVIQL